MKPKKFIEERPVERKTGKRKQHTSMLTTHKQTLNPAYISHELGEDFSNDDYVALKMKELFSALRESRSHDNNNYIERHTGMFQHFLKERGLPWDDTLRYETKDGGRARLCHLLEKEHDDIPGAREAGDALFEIATLKNEIKKGNSDKALTHALRLLPLVERLIIAQYEPQILAGRARTSEASQSKQKTAQKFKTIAKQYFKEYEKKGNTNKSHIYQLISNKLKSEHDFDRKSRTIKGWHLDDWK